MQEEYERLYHMLEEEPQRLRMTGDGHGRDVDLQGLLDRLSILQQHNDEAIEVLNAMRFNRMPRTRSSGLEDWSSEGVEGDEGIFERP